MRIDPENSNHYIADDNKEFQRISDNFNFGSEIYLGYTYYINGVKLDEPKLETIDDFVEVDKEVAVEALPPAPQGQGWRPPIAPPLNV